MVGRQKEAAGWSLGVALGPEGPGRGGGHQLDWSKDGGGVVLREEEGRGDFPGHWSQLWEH